jgi:hypothetical protein
MNLNSLASGLLWIFFGFGQTSAQEAQPINIEAERGRISVERALHESTFLQMERTCYARFAVFDCLLQARKDRRAALDPLRRQELILNEMERKFKALSAIHRIQEKTAAQQPLTTDENGSSHGPASVP